MSKEKQIEQMAKILCRGGCEKCIQTLCADWYKAEDLYGAGYRKQSEWISVEDRLPAKFTKVLCFYPSKKYGSSIVVDYMESDDGSFAEQFRHGAPTHWMPLPKPPTEKEN